jgi:hypothetical protein
VTRARNLLVLFEATLGLLVKAGYANSNRYGMLSWKQGITGDRQN